MAESSSSSERPHSKDQVLSALGDSFDGNTNDKYRQLRPHSSDVQSKRDFEEADSEMSSAKTDSHSNSSDNSGVSDVCQGVLPDKKTTAVSFSIEMGNTCVKQPPKRLLVKAKQQKKATSTLESLNDKQKQAEKRRKQQRQEKLQRIHDRQEAARKLAENVDILLQQRALAMGVADKSVKRLPSGQIMATAHQVALNFKDLTKQLGNDLSVNERKTNERLEAKKSNATCPKNEIGTGLEKKKSTSQSLSFTVEVPACEVKGKSRRPALSAKQKKVLTAEDLEEKQRRAEQRRKERQERRVRRVQENREALMNMAKDIEKFEKLQLEIDSSPASAKQTKETAMLAEKIAARFDRLSQRYNEDLKRAENFSLEQPFIIQRLSDAVFDWHHSTIE